MLTPGSPTQKYPVDYVLKGRGRLFSFWAFAFLFFGASHLPLFSQGHLFDAHLLTPEDGLANLMATAIYKDSRSFMWIGTRYGLNRYDGYTFELYTKEENALFNNEGIRHICEDGEGNLWLFYEDLRIFGLAFGEVHSVSLFNPETEQAVSFDDWFAGNAPFKAAEIYLPKITDPRNRLWMCTRKGGLFLYDGGFKKIFQQEGVLFEYLTVDQENNIWLAWKNRAIGVDASGKVVEEVVLPAPICGIWASTGNSLWISTMDLEREGSINIWRKAEDGEIASLPLTRNGSPVELKPRKTPYLHFNQNGYWFIIADDQLQLFNRQGEWLFNYHTLLGKGSNTDFLDVFEDGARLWLSTSNGVVKASAAANPFQLIHHKEDIASDCRGITEDEWGNIYFLNTNLFLWDKHKQRLRMPTEKQGTYALAYADSILWAGDYTLKTLGFEINLRTNEVFRYPVLDPNHHLVNTLLPVNTPGRFLAGQNQGLVYLDLTDKKLAPFEKYNGFEALKTSEVNFMHQNAFGIWLATSSGVFLMTEKEGVVRHFNTASGDLPFDRIRHIHEDSDGNRDGIFWLATQGGGIIRWRPAAGREQKSEFRQFTADEGLSNNYTYAIYEDDFGKLWIPSDKGLMQMDKASFRVRVFTTDDGLPHNEFNHTSHYQAKDGTLYFGGLGGLIAFHPRVFAKEGLNSTPLAFTGCYILEEQADKMTDRTQQIQESGTITIRPGDKFFELHFTLLDYEDTDKHRYAYQIEGYSDNWNYIDENYIRITNLPYGRYTLRIQGQNSSHGWSEQELSLAIHVAKPFYLQWWFITAVAVLIAGAVTGSVEWRIRQLKKGKERLEAEVRKRTLTIQQQAEELKVLDKAKTRFFSNITHEFRTPLTLIIGPLEQVVAEPALPSIFRKRIAGILKNARHLLTLINQMLDLSKIEGGRMKTEAARGDIIAYTREIVSRFQALAKKKEQQLNFVTPLDHWDTHFDKEKWDKILYNLLSNAIKFTPAGQAIQASLMKIQRGQQDYIRLDVKDSGIGLEEEQLLQIFDRFYQADNSSTRAQGGTGIGLALVKELVELQGGEIRVSSEVSKGTTFEVYLPVLEGVQALPLVAEPAPESIALPLAEEEGPVPATPASVSREGVKLELLLIEDNAEMREYIRYCIDSSQYSITEAADGREGIEKAQALIPDLIISDVMMPKKNGFEVVKAIRGHIGTS
ncbi:MAG: response regulator, partial [Phaeodactylibacter sp.]|nr:response regulator [Phaeodactylibacter sp.]